MGVRLVWIVWSISLPRRPISIPKVIEYTCQYCPVHIHALGQQSHAKLYRVSHMKWENQWLKFIPTKFRTIYWKSTIESHTNTIHDNSLKIIDWKSYPSKSWKCSENQWLKIIPTKFLTIGWKSVILRLPASPGPQTIPHGAPAWGKITRFLLVFGLTSGHCNSLGSFLAGANNIQQM